MGVSNRADGRVQVASQAQSPWSENGGHVEARTKVVTFKPVASLPKGKSMYYETVLPVPMHVNRRSSREEELRRQGYVGYVGSIASMEQNAGPGAALASAMAMMRNPAGFTRIQPSREEDPYGHPLTTKLNEPYDVVSGCTDQLLKTIEVWRINFIFDKGPQDNFLLTLQDETRGVMLFTIQVSKNTINSARAKIETPLQRFMRQETKDQEETLWDALREDD